MSRAEAFASRYAVTNCDLNPMLRDSPRWCLALRSGWIAYLSDSQETAGIANVGVVGDAALKVR